MWGGVRGWPDPEGRFTRTPDFGSGHTPARVKAEGADSKVWRPLLKYVIVSNVKPTFFKDRLLSFSY